LFYLLSKILLHQLNNFLQQRQSIAKKIFTKPDGSAVISGFTNSTIPVGLAQKITNLDPTRPSNPLKGGASTQQEKTNTLLEAQNKLIKELIKKIDKVISLATNNDKIKD
jgi:hypothetical protein